VPLSRLIGAIALIGAVAAASSAEPQAERVKKRTGDAIVKATAYCQGGTTRSGTRARPGIVAADPAFFPVGTILRILDGPWSGIYTVMDTGAEVKGREIDIFIPDCARAKRFGRRTLHVRILRHGWDPQAISDF